MSPRRSGPSAQSAARTRDPHRSRRILDAAAELISRHGYHAVSIAEIGAAAGITGSGIYRHFDGKSTILVALFDLIIDDLIQDQAHVLAEPDDAVELLNGLIDLQVQFVVGQRELARVYYNEIQNLPQADRTRLRRKQRLYVEEWVHLASVVAPGRTDSEARTVVLAAIGAIQSCLFHRRVLEPDVLGKYLVAAARSIMAGS
jgi:AcrR family transcriptional regulator